MVAFQFYLAKTKINQSQPRRMSNSQLDFEGSIFCVKRNIFQDGTASGIPQYCSVAFHSKLRKLRSKETEDDCFSR
jgi:hypothetical protein